MTNRLADVEARARTVDELSSVVTAMRGIAAARARDALERLSGIRACAEVIAAAIADAMTLTAPASPAAPNARPASGQIVVAIGTEQGFVGTFNHRIIEAAQRAATTGTAYLVIGERARLAAAELDVPVAWSSEMAAHANAVPEIANRIVNELYDRLGDADVSHVALVHGAPQAVEAARIVTTSLLPFDFARFGPVTRPFPPLVTLAPRPLQESLAEEYVYTQICEAIVLALAAENEARMRAMMAARRNIDDMARRLRIEHQRLRQEQITAEIVELSPR